MAQKMSSSAPTGRAQVNSLLPGAWTKSRASWSAASGVAAATDTITTGSISTSLVLIDSRWWYSISCRAASCRPADSDATSG